MSNNIIANLLLTISFIGMVCTYQRGSDSLNLSMQNIRIKKNY